jgi:predicted kinase
VRRIARRLARFHAAAATGPGVDEHGRLATVRGNWAENFAQMSPYVGRTISRGVQAAIADFVEQSLSREARLFARRVAAGRVRDGHGDLHAASVCVEGRRLHLFDCLEFAARFRCADVVAEVAFLAMDLDHHGRADLAAAFVDAYVRASGDDELRRLLDFYKCYRAYVRGKVTSFRLAEPGMTEAESGALEATARCYFDLALAYATDQGQPVLVVAMGLPASGKTTLAGGLAGRLGLVHVSSDVVRKELAGLEPTAHRTEGFGQGLYAPAMTRRTYAALHRRAGRWLRTGRSVVLDATYSRVRERRAVRRLAARLGVPLVVLVCRAGAAVLRARLAAREADSRTASDARLDLWPALRAAFEEPVAFPGAVACVSLQTSGPPAAALEQALSVVRTHSGVTGSGATSKVA